MELVELLAEATDLLEESMRLTPELCSAIAETARARHLAAIRRRLAACCASVGRLERTIERGAIPQ